MLQIENGVCSNNVLAKGVVVFLSFRASFSVFVCLNQNTKNTKFTSIIEPFVYIMNVECRGYGPRVTVRSIKRIKKGEEVTVTYTDLLQPKVSAFYLYTHYTWISDWNFEFI